MKNNKTYLIIVLLIIIFIMCIIVYKYCNDNYVEEVIIKKEEKDNFEKEEVIQEVELDKTEEKIYYFVDIKGAVNNPNVYKVEENSRVIDQTTPNMIQRISGIFERNPLISREI